MEIMLGIMYPCPQTISARISISMEFIPHYHHQPGSQAGKQTGQARVDERAQVHDKIKERVFVRSFVPLSMLCSTNLLLLPPTIIKLFLCKDFDSSTRGKESVADM